MSLEKNKSERKPTSISEWRWTDNNTYNERTKTIGTHLREDPNVTSPQVWPKEKADRNKRS